jgi:hypothetical protein
LFLSPVTTDGRAYAGPMSEIPPSMTLVTSTT